jgi:hypothetical protein
VREQEQWEEDGDGADGKDVEMDVSKEDRLVVAGQQDESMMQVVLHEDKNYYPSASEGAVRPAPLPPLGTPCVPWC